ncbi:MAG TPA: hypothetical protein ENI30_05745, partial [Gammaproteobacteria bacterium]|nr:hypothetical protein [Gammaproteobacteria bacterium]
VQDEVGDAVGPPQHHNSLGFSVPVFWMGLLLIQVFAFGLGWFPATGSKGFESLILPASRLPCPKR